MSSTQHRYRLEYLDWLRGIGAVIMLQGHGSSCRGAYSPEAFAIRDPQAQAGLVST
jgi:uncharacterized membrane protein